MFLRLKAIDVTLIMASVMLMNAITTPTICNFEKDMCGFINVGNGTWKIGNETGYGNALEGSTKEENSFQVDKFFSQPMCVLTFKYFKHTASSLSATSGSKPDVKVIWNKSIGKMKNWTQIGNITRPPFRMLSLRVNSKKTSKDQVFAFDDITVYPCISTNTSVLSISTSTSQKSTSPFTTENFTTNVHKSTSTAQRSTPTTQKSTSAPKTSQSVDLHGITTSATNKAIVYLQLASNDKNKHNMRMKNKFYISIGVYFFVIGIVIFALFVFRKFRRSVVVPYTNVSLPLDVHALKTKNDMTEC